MVIDEGIGIWIGIWIGTDVGFAIGLEENSLANILDGIWFTNTKAIKNIYISILKDV